MARYFTFLTILVLIATALPPASRADTPPPTPSGYVRIEPGTFIMGSSPEEEGRKDDKTERIYPVQITRAFWMQKTEVTVSEWQF